MSTVNQRLAELEQKVAALTQRIDRPPTNKKWLSEIWGAFANDPDFKQAMAHGKKWRAGSPKSTRTTRKTPRK